MAQKLGGLYYSTGVDNSGLRKGLNETNRLAGMSGDQIKKSLNKAQFRDLKKQMRNELSSSKKIAKKEVPAIQKAFDALKFPGIAAGTVAAGYAISSFVNSAINEASDFEEAYGKFSVVFKGQEDAAIKLRDTLVNSYSQSKIAATEALSSIQDLLVPMGVAPKLATQLSGEIAKMVVDFASFNNLETATVLRDFQSALVGNYGTMKKYGIVLTANAVKQRVVSEGFVDNAEDASVAAKALAAVNIIMESSDAAMGDAIRTSESLANKKKELTAAYSDLKVSIGQEFLPYAQKTTQWMIDFTKKTEASMPTIRRAFDIFNKTIQSSYAVLAGDTETFNKIQVEKELLLAKQRGDIVSKSLSAQQMAYLKAEREKNKISKAGSAKQISEAEKVKKETIKIIKDVNKNFKNSQIKITKESTVQKRARVNATKKALNEQKRLVKSFNDEYIEAVHGRQSLEIAKLEEKTSALRKAGVDQLKIDEFYAVKKQEIFEASTAKEKKEFEKRQQVKEAFDADHIKSTQDKFALEILELSKKTADYEKAGMDQLKVDEFYKSEYNRIIDEKTEYEDRARKEQAKKEKEAAEDKIKASEGFFNGMKIGYDDMLKNQKTMGQHMTSAGRATFGELQGAFKGSFLDVINGDFEDIGENWSGLWDGMKLKMSGVLADMAAQELIKLAARLTGSIVSGVASMVDFDMESFAGGYFDVKQDQVAIVHKGEMIVPEQLAERLRLMSESGFDPMKESGMSNDMIGFGESLGLTDSDGILGDFANNLGNRMMGGFTAAVTQGLSFDQALSMATNPMAAFSSFASAMGTFAADKTFGQDNKFAKWGKFLGATAPKFFGMGLPGLGQFTGYAGALVGDALGDAMNMRDFEQFRDAIEDAVPGYFDAKNYSAEAIKEMVEHYGIEANTLEQIMDDFPELMSQEIKDAVTDYGTYGGSGGEGGEGGFGDGSVDAGTDAGHPGGGPMGPMDSSSFYHDGGVVGKSRSGDSEGLVVSKTGEGYLSTAGMKAFDALNKGDLSFFQGKDQKQIINLTVKIGDKELKDMVRAESDALVTMRYDRNINNSVRTWGL